jgi:hypothetical protein
MSCVIALFVRKEEGLVWFGTSSRRRRTGLVWLACFPEEGAVCSSPSQPEFDQITFEPDNGYGRRKQATFWSTVSLQVEWNFRLKGQCYGILDSKLF